MLAQPADETLRPVCGSLERCADVVCCRFEWDAFPVGSVFFPAFLFLRFNFISDVFGFKDLVFEHEGEVVGETFKDGLGLFCRFAARP